MKKDAIINIMASSLYCPIECIKMAGRVTVIKFIRNSGPEAENRHRAS